MRLYEISDNRGMALDIRSATTRDVPLILEFIRGLAEYERMLDQVQAIYEQIWSGGECAACKLRVECPGPLVQLGAKRRRTK